MIFNCAKKIMGSFAITQEILLGVIYNFNKIIAHQFKVKIAMNFYLDGISLLMVFI
jgi:hypothetical protein